MTDRRPKHDPDAPITFAVADACLCGSLLRVNTAVGARRINQARQAFRDRHTGPGHGPAEVVIDARRHRLE